MHACMYGLTSKLFIRNKNLKDAQINTTFFRFGYGNWLDNACIQVFIQSNSIARGSQLMVQIY